MNKETMMYANDFVLPSIATSNNRCLRISNNFLPLTPCKYSGLLYIRLNSPLSMRDKMSGSSCADPTRHADILALFKSITCACIKAISGEITKTIRFLNTAGNYAQQLSDI